MAELIKKISAFPDAYDDFILGVINYAKLNPEHVSTLLKYLEMYENLSASDVVHFIMTQPDFHSYSAVRTSGEVITY